VKRISKKVREEAILGLLCAAYDHAESVPVDSLQSLAMSAGVSEEVAFGLCYRAWLSVLRYVVEFDDACLEAAALLRDGWNPGDPVEVRS
jgi:hypothetical protein